MIDMASVVTRSKGAGKRTPVPTATTSRHPDEPAPPASGSPAESVATTSRRYSGAFLPEVQPSDSVSRTGSQTTSTVSSRAQRLSRVAAAKLRQAAELKKIAIRRRRRELEEEEQAIELQTEVDLAEADLAALDEATAVVAAMDPGPGTPRRSSVAGGRGSRVAGDRSVDPPVDDVLRSEGTRQAEAVPAEAGDGTPARAEAPPAEAGDRTPAPATPDNRENRLLSMGTEPVTNRPGTPGREVDNRRGREEPWYPTPNFPSIERTLCRPGTGDVDNRRRLSEQRHWGSAVPSVRAYEEPPRRRSPVRPAAPRTAEEHLSALIGTLRAPAVELPQFSGDRMAYHRFIKAFEENVEKALPDMLDGRLQVWI